MRGSEEYLSWLIALVIVAPIGIILALIYLFGTSPVSHELSSASSYVSYVTSSIYSGSSYIAGGISPSLNENQVLFQIYVNNSCLYYLDLLGRNGLLLNPVDPRALLNKFAVCTATINNNALGKYAWVFSSSNSLLPVEYGIPPWIVQGANYIANNNVTYVISSSINYTLSEINGSHGFMSFYYPYEYDDLNLVENEGAFSCIKFFGSVINNQLAAQYLSQISCAALPIENSNPTFIAIPTYCYPNLPCYAPMAFLHGSPARFLLQICKYQFNEFICQTKLA
jgi:hypothetical protein